MPSARLPGRRAQARRLLRRRRCVVSDGGYGHRRDSVERRGSGCARGSPDRAGHRRSRPGRRAVHARAVPRLVAEEYDKLQHAGNRDVHDDSKTGTLPIAREIVETYIGQPVELAVVRGSPERQPRRPGPRDGSRTDRPLHGRLRRRRHADNGEPGLRMIGPCPAMNRGPARDHGGHVIGTISIAALVSRAWRSHIHRASSTADALRTHPSSSSARLPTCHATRDTPGSPPTLPRRQAS